MSSLSVKIGDPDFDPYEILGIEQGCSDAEITKAYRKLALKLHPDKVQNLSEQEQDRMAKEFHVVQEARAFLLEPEHAEARRAFDTKRASQRLRRQQDAVRESQMSERRKRMREELKRKEEATQSADQEDVLEKLRKEGKDLREKHSSRAQEKQARKASRAEKKARTLKEERQVRVKWSRKRMKVSPSEHSLAQLLSKYGPVESVEILGSKGNGALVTFEKASSCRPCVDAYETSDEMRATFVGKKRQEYEEEMYQREEEKAPIASISKRQDTEGLEERKHRQAAERERLAREMEMEDAGHGGMDRKNEPVTKQKKSRPFPLEFDVSLDGTSLTPLQKLEQFETTVFGGFLSPEELELMKVSSTNAAS